MSIPACETLRSFERTLAPDFPEFHFLHFWKEFPTDPNASIQTMFRALFGGIGLRKPVAFWSVFPENHPGFDEAPFRARTHVHVAFSGERHFLDPSGFDLNLIIAADDPARNVVSFVPFAAYAHEFDLWSSFSSARPVGLAKRFCVAVVSNDSCEVRNRFLLRLNRRKGVDSCGRWLNTVGFLAPRDQHRFGDRYLHFLRNYKFMVCFENARQSYYLTEKLANAYAGGCVPVYWGARETKQWLNARAFLQLDDESDAAMDALIERMCALDADPDAHLAIFGQPLVVGPVPDLMRVETIRKKIADTLRRTRPDAFADIERR
jgi:hypothetical protein